MSFVYGSPTPHLRKKLWEDLNLQKLQCSGPWIVVGDFNATLSTEETTNSRNLLHQGATNFRKWIFDERLIDIGFLGQVFTWMQVMRDHTVKGARLDRALCNLDWYDRFPEATVSHLARVGSDHFPVLVRTTSVNEEKPNPPFRFQIA